MGTHPIFESDFDCLTEMSNQWGYMNPETYVKKKTETKSLGLLETKKSDSENSDSENEQSNMMSEMAKFLDDVEKDDEAKQQKKEAKKRKKEESKAAKIEPNRWGPWIEYFDKDTKHPYYFNMETKETVWKLSESTKRKYETRDSDEKSRSPSPPSLVPSRSKRRRQRSVERDAERQKVIWWQI